MRDASVSKYNEYSPIRVYVVCDCAVHMFPHIFNKAYMSKSVHL